MCSSTETFNKFVVLGDMTITCYFVKDDVVGDVPSTAMIGHMPTQPQFCRAYVELGNVDGNKFTEGSRGVAAIFVTDDNRSEIDASDKQATTSCRAKAFFVPMNILGIMDDNGRKYLRFDGGIIKYTLSVSDDTALGFLSNPLLKLMLAFDGRDRGELEPGAYRIEIVEGSPEEGAITLGELQRLSARYGWINSDDESFTKRLPAFFGPKYSKGLSSDFFAGTRLSTTKPTAIQWEPSEDFFADRSLLEQLAASLGELYRKAVKGTRLEDYDMQQFSTDLDNHVFKALGFKQIFKQHFHFHSLDYRLLLSDGVCSCRFVFVAFNIDYCVEIGYFLLAGGISILAAGIEKRACGLNVSAAVFAALFAQKHNVEICRNGKHNHHRDQQNDFLCFRHNNFLRLNVV